MNRNDLKKFQSRLSGEVYDNKDYVCWLDVGGGKTVVTLDALARLHEDFLMEKTLIVSTKRIVQHVWPAELQKWEQSKHFRIATREDLMAARQKIKDPEYRSARTQVRDYEKVIKLKGKRRVAKEILTEYRKVLKIVRGFETEVLLGIDADIHLLNVENFRWLVNTLGTKWSYDTVVFDESSLFRNHASKRFKAAKSIKPYINRVIELTGTPAPNGYEGLWAQYYLIDSGDRLEPTITKYRDKYFTKSFTGFDYNLNKGADVTIQEHIRDVTASLNVEDHMELGPEPIHENIELTLSEDLTHQYKRLERDFFLEIQDETVIALSQAVKSNKLRQFCNGGIYANTNDKRKAVNVHDLKLKALEEIVEISAGNPIIVAYEFLPEAHKIKKKFPKAYTIDNFDQIKWDKGEIPMLIVHPRSAGHGMNLQHGGHRVVWYSTMIDLELYDQLNGRIGQVRQAQSGYFRAPIYYHLYFKGTIEEDLIKRRNQKDVTQKSLLQSLYDGVERRAA